MPQSSQIIGVNSVTNIELDKGVLPAPIIRNADWFGKLVRIRAAGRILCLAGGTLSEGTPSLLNHCSLPLQDSGKLPIC